MKKGIGNRWKVCSFFFKFFQIKILFFSKTHFFPLFFDKNITKSFSFGSRFIIQVSNGHGVLHDDCSVYGVCVVDREGARESNRIKGCGCGISQVYNHVLLNVDSLSLTCCLITVLSMKPRVFHPTTHPAMNPATTETATDVNHVLAVICFYGNTGNSCFFL